MPVSVSKLSPWSLSDPIEFERLSFLLGYILHIPLFPATHISLTGNVLPSQGHRAGWLSCSTENQYTPAILPRTLAVEEGQVTHSGQWTMGQ